MRAQERLQVQLCGVLPRSKVFFVWKMTCKEQASSDSSPLFMGWQQCVGSNCQVSFENQTRSIFQGLFCKRWVSATLRITIKVKVKDKTNTQRNQTPKELNSLVIAALCRRISIDAYLTGHFPLYFVGLFPISQSGPQIRPVVSGKSKGNYL